MRLNVDKTYSLMELDRLLSDIDDDVSMGKVLRKVRSRTGLITADAILAVGSELGLNHAAWAVKSALDARRKEERSPTIAGDDDVLTVGQLREAVQEVVKGFTQGRWVTVGSADDFVDQVMEKVNHPWAGGDIVEDATGTLYQKRHTDDKWQTFGTSTRYDYMYPKRPLRKVN